MAKRATIFVPSINNVKHDGALQGEQDHGT